MWNFSKTFVKNFSFVIAVSMLLSSQLSAQSSINTVGGFEGDMPSYWHPGNVPSGAECIAFDGQIVEDNQRRNRCAGKLGIV
jgi:hypothetical protein